MSHRKLTVRGYVFPAKGSIAEEYEDGPLYSGHEH